MHDDDATPRPHSSDDGWQPRRAPNSTDPGTEPFPGALVLWDIENAAPDDAATVLARYLVFRCLAAAARGDLAGFLAERRLARPYIAHAPEIAAIRLRRVLGRRACAPRWLFRGLVAIGLHAESCGHAGGTLTFLGLAYRIALGAGQPRAALRVAERLAELTCTDDAPGAARRWTARARRLRDQGRNG